MSNATSPFSALVAEVGHPDGLRAAITAAYRRPEPDCLPPLIETARLDRGAACGGAAVAPAGWSSGCGPSQRQGGVEALVQEYALSSQEGVALMCLAEALLRIPDSRHPRRADPRQDRRRRLARRISATAGRCSSTPRPGAWW